MGTNQMTATAKRVQSSIGKRFVIGYAAVERQRVPTTHVPGRSGAKTRSNTQRGRRTTRADLNHLVACAW